MGDNEPQGSRRERHLRTPTSGLTPEERVRRGERHLQVLTGILLLVLALLIYSALFELDSWSEWVVFGVICATAVGATIAIHSRN